MANFYWILYYLKEESCDYSSRIEQSSDSFVYKTEIPTNIDSDLIVKAFAWVESRWNDSIIGKTNDVGYLQITPVLVEDVNRITGLSYSLEDRFYREKSIEMFWIIMNHYGCDTYEKMCKKWNPNAPRSYYEKIMDAFETLKSQRHG
jgi:hypothetical protein